MEFAHVEVEANDGKHEDGKEEQQANLQQRYHSFHNGLQYHLKTWCRQEKHAFGNTEDYFILFLFLIFHLLESGRTVRKHRKGEIITWHAAKSKPNSLPPLDDIFSRLHLGFLSKVTWAWWKTSGLFSFINVASYLWLHSESSLKSSHWSTVSTDEFIATSGGYSNRLI